MTGPLVRQVGYLVSDLHAAIVDFAKLGVEHWTTFPVDPGGTYLGQDSTGTLSIALGYVGELQIELIEAEGQGQSIWHHDRDRGQFGIHHVAHWREDFDAAMAELVPTSELIQEGDSGVARFAYARTASGLLLEVMEMTPVAEWFMRDIEG